MQHPTILAYVMMWLVVPATMLAFSQLPAPRAVLAVLLGTVLFLPELLQFDAPLIPTLDKLTLPALCIFCGVYLGARPKFRSAKPGHGIDRLMLLSLVALAGTIFTNQDTLHYGPKTIQGQGPYDLVSFSLSMALHTFVPFLVGRTMFRTSSDARDLLKALVIAFLIYSPLILFELKMSPQLHSWIYGYRQHAWGQVKRADGWRPQVFMHHGLALALFVCASALASWALVRARVRAVRWLHPTALAIYVTVILALLNSLGALVYGIVLVPLMWVLTPRAQLRLAAGLGIIVFLYPVLRLTGIFPAQDICDFFYGLSPERGASLGFRFTNEDMLLDKFWERPLFGWSYFARGHIWTSEGKNISVIDGAWIAILGRGGFAEYITYFGLLVLPLGMALRSLPRVPREHQRLLAGVGMISIVYTLDLLPNGGFNDLPIFLAGTLAGLSQGLAGEKGARLTRAEVARLAVVLWVRRRLSQAAALQGNVTSR